MSFVMSLDTESFLGLINKAIEEDMNDKLWSKWLTFAPHMENQVSFEEYKRQHTQINPIDRTDDEILTDAESILKMFNTTPTKEGE